jgi:hypothetical protein
MSTFTYCHSQSQDLQRLQHFYAGPTPNNYTQTPFYQQPPYSSNPQTFYDSPQPDMTSAENPSAPASSVGQQNLGATQPQHRGHSTTNQFDISFNSPFKEFIDTSIWKDSQAGHGQNNNEPSLDIDNEVEDNGIDLKEWMKGYGLG